MKYVVMLMLMLVYCGDSLIAADSYAHISGSHRRKAMLPEEFEAAVENSNFELDFYRQVAPDFLAREGWSVYDVRYILLTAALTGHVGKLKERLEELLVRDRRDLLVSQIYQRKTALQLAAERGFCSVVDILLQSGSESMRNEIAEIGGAQKAYNLALLCGHLDVVMVFEENL